MMSINDILRGWMMAGGLTFAAVTTAIAVSSGLSFWDATLVFVGGLHTGGATFIAGLLDKRWKLI